MKKYIADTNFYLRFILQDNKNQAERTRVYLEKARLKKISIYFPDEVVLEMVFVLGGYYHFEKRDILTALSSLISCDYLQFEDRNLWLAALRIYKDTNVSLIDILVFVKAKEYGKDVISYDNDFKKLVKKYG